VTERFRHVEVARRQAWTVLRLIGVAIITHPEGKSDKKGILPLFVRLSRSTHCPPIANLTNLFFFSSHILELENRIKWLEEIVSTRCLDVDLAAGPPVELRSRPAPPDIRIVTTGADFDQTSQSVSASSSPVFALSPSSTCATPLSFDFSSPGVSPRYLQPMSPFTFSEAGPSRAPSPGSTSPLQKPQDTFSHEISLLSLSASEEPKYLGPSSGVNFSRMVFKDIKDADFQPNDAALESRHGLSGLEAKPIPLPSREQCIVFTKAYFDAIQLQYPFLYKPTFEACLDAVYRSEDSALPSDFTPATARFQVFIVLSIGAHILSTRPGHSWWDSEGYFAAAMNLKDEVSLTGSVQGVQSALLLAMRSLYASGGWDLWYLNAIIMATCLDLGLQRRLDVPGENVVKFALRRRIFWSAYSLDRCLSAALGRPFAVRDEAFDVEFPDDLDGDDDVYCLSRGTHPASSILSSRTAFGTTVNLFKIVKIMSGICSTAYRTPSHTGLWNTELTQWQMSTYFQLTELRDSAQAPLQVSGHSCTGFLWVDLRYHEAVQLLFRPSPIFPQPSVFAMQKCFHSAIETIRLYDKLRRQHELPYTRLTEHSVLLAGLTMLHTHRRCHEAQLTTANESLMEEVRCCSQLLADLSQRWWTAEKSRFRFDALAQSILANPTTIPTASRMLSPHDGARRPSGGSLRSFVDPKTLEVPPPQATTSSQLDWNGFNFENMDMGWMEGLHWESLQLDPGDGAKIVPTEDEHMVMMEDTAMWGMHQDTSQLHNHHQQQPQQQ
jgi:hypothetical protein